MDHTIIDVLLYTGLVLILVHFYFFNKTINTISKEEKDRYVKDAGSKTGLIITIILFGCLFYFRGLEMNLLFSFLIVSSMVFGTVIHHKRLRALSFDDVFEKRLLKISYISLVGVVLILSSITLNAYAT